MASEKPRLIFPPGACIVMTSGEYSDFGAIAILVTRVRVDLRAEGERYKAEAAFADPYGFPAWLCAQGMAMDASYTEVHCGNYGSFSLDEE